MERERGPRRTGGVAGRQVRLRVSAPWWPVLRTKVGFSRKVGRGLSRRPAFPSSFLDGYVEPQGPGWTRTLAHPALPVGKAPRCLGSVPQNPLSPQPCPGPGGWVVRMYSIILFWKLDASSFLILYKEETNKVCFCVYCLFIVL